MGDGRAKFAETPKPKEMTMMAPKTTEPIMSTVLLVLSWSSVPAKRGARGSPLVKERSPRPWSRGAWCGRRPSREESGALS